MKIIRQGVQICDNYATKIVISRTSTTNEYDNTLDDYETLNTRFTVEIHTIGLPLDPFHNYDIFFGPLIEGCQTQTDVACLFRKNSKSNNKTTVIGHRNEPNIQAEPSNRRELFSQFVWIGRSSATGG